MQNTCVWTCSVYNFNCFCKCVFKHRRIPFELKSCSTAHQIRKPKYSNFQCHLHCLPAAMLIIRYRPQHYLLDQFAISLVIPLCILWSSNEKVGLRHARANYLNHNHNIFYPLCWRLCSGLEFKSWCNILKLPQRQGGTNLQISFCKYFLTCKKKDRQRTLQCAVLLIV